MQPHTTLDSIQRLLDSAQWWPPTVMRRHQFALVAPLVAHAYRTVPWYRRVFDDLKLDVERGIDSNQWRSLPLLTRRDIQDAHGDLHSTDPPPAHGPISTRMTGGSTGTPVTVRTTELAQRFWIAITLREYQWQDCDVSRKLAVIRDQPPGVADPPNGASLDTWGRATAGRLKTGPSVILGVRSTTAEQAAWLESERPAYLQAYPSIVHELARYCLARGLAFPELQCIYTFGEAINERLREVCRAAWNVEVLDSYSTSEVGHVAVQCRQGGSYHIQSEHLLVDVLDERDEPCLPGQVGRVVVTDLFNYAMPLLRYDIGDYAEVGSPCPCGRNLPTLRRILGRQRNMFVLPNGEKYWPTLDSRLATVAAARLPVRQFQAIQRSRAEIEARLVVDRPLTPSEQAAIQQLINEGLSSNFNVRFAYVDKIPRGPSGKYEDFRCEVDASHSL
jgi:phenylacetate-CoA ligase